MNDKELDFQLMKYKLMKLKMFILSMYTYLLKLIIMTLKNNFIVKINSYKKI